jgi:hypothetical protein
MGMIGACSGLALWANVAQDFCKAWDQSSVQSPNWHMNVGALKEMLYCSYLLRSGPKNKIL